MMERIIFRRRPNSDPDKRWVVFVRGGGARDIPLSLADPKAEPTGTNNASSKLWVKVHKNINDKTYYAEIYFPQGGSSWYKITLKNTYKQGNFKFRLQTGITIVNEKKGSGDNWHGWEALKQMNNPPDTADLDTSEDCPEFHDENPRWVKIGGRWYYIG